LLCIWIIKNQSIRYNSSNIFIRIKRKCIIYFQEFLQIQVINIESKIQKIKEALPSVVKSTAEQPIFPEAEQFFAAANAAGEELLKAIKVSIFFTALVKPTRVVRVDGNCSNVGEGSATLTNGVSQK
jgi:hypothetical protein